MMNKVVVVVVVVAEKIVIVNSKISRKQRPLNLNEKQRRARHGYFTIA